MELANVLLRAVCTSTSLVRHLPGAGVSEEAAGVIGSLAWISHPAPTASVRSMVYLSLPRRDFPRDVVNRGRAQLEQINVDLQGFTAEGWARLSTFDGEQ